MQNFEQYNKVFIAQVLCRNKFILLIQRIGASNCTQNDNGVKKKKHICQITHVSSRASKNDIYIKLHHKIYPFC